MPVESKVVVPCEGCADRRRCREKAPIYRQALRAYIYDGPPIAAPDCLRESHWHGRERRVSPAPPSVGGPRC